jgi:hypothetical protein
MVEVQILGEFQTRRIMQTSLSWLRSYEGIWIWMEVCAQQENITLKNKIKIMGK